MSNPVKVLIVEDSEDDAKLALRALRRGGFDPTYRRVQTAAELEAALAQERWDAVISDFNMPGFTGMDAVRIFRSTGLDIPFILISGTIGEETAVDAMKAGASDYVMKKSLARLAPALEREMKETQMRAAHRGAQRGLIESEQRFRQMAENIRDVFFLVDADSNRMLYVSPAYEAIWGRSCESLYRNPKSWTEAIHPDDRASSYRKCKKGMSAGQFEFEFRIAHPDGSTRCIEMKGFPVRDDAGNIARIAGVAGDITERKDTEISIGRLNRVHAVLSGINTLIVRVQDQQELFNETCRIAVEHGGFGIAWIGMLKPDTSAIVLVACGGVDSEWLSQRLNATRDDILVGQGIVGRAIREKRAAFSNDITTEPTPGGAHRQEAIRRGYRSLIVLPLAIQGVVVGNLSLYAREPNFFNKDEINLLTELAGNISFALEHISRQQKLEKLSRVRLVTGEINAAIVHARSKQELFNEACRIAVEYGNFGIAWIGLYDPGAGTVTPAAWGGKDDSEHIRNFVADVRDEQSLGRGELIRAIREKTLIFSNDISADPDEGGMRRQEAVRRGYRSHIVLPLMTEGQVVATLGLFTKELDFFTEDEVKVLEEMASDISFALQSIARQEKIEKLSRTRAVSSGINSILVRVRSGQELFQQSCRVAVEDGQFPFAWIGVLDQATQDVTPVAWAGEGAEELTRAKSSARNDTQTGKGAVGRAIRERRPVFNNDITAHNFGGPRVKEILRLGFRSQLTLPLFDDQTVVGTLTIYAREPNFFDEEEVKLLTELAADISFALENISRQQKLDKLARIRAVSSEINAAIVRIHDREALLRETCRITTEQGKFELVWIALLDQEKQKVQVVAWTGFSPDAAHAVSWASLSAVRGTLSEVIRTGKAAIRNDIDTETRVGHLRQEAMKKGCRSIACVPFAVDDNVVAVMNLYAPGVGFFDEEELALFNEVAADVSFALQAIEKQEKLNYLAYYDVLTGLANRRLFLDRVAQYVRSAASGGHKLALFLIDLERFKNINDSLGRPAGDALLRQVAEWMARNLGDANLLARVGADHFAAVLPEVKQEGDAARLVEKMMKAFLDHPFRLSDAVFRIAAKVGIALFPDDGADADTLFRNAEAALKEAKVSGDRYLFHMQKMTDSVAGKLTLENQLRQALDKGEFVLHYQPKVNLVSGRVSGLEALIRWNDPETGLVPPLQFIPLLEETGMILEVGRWAIHKALQDYNRWYTRGLQQPHIAVNVSPVQLRQKDFVDVVRNAIQGFTAAPHGLDLEITESLIMEDIEGNIEKLRAVRDMGVNIAVDDFGTGYSSLAYLARLPVSALKIDRSFIINMASNADNMSIISTIISLAHSLSLNVIAEGVETEEQSKYLKLLKCDEAQGYLFSKPLPADQIETLLLQENKSAPKSPK